MSLMRNSSSRCATTSARPAPRADDVCIWLLPGRGGSESAGVHFGAERIDGMKRCRWDARLERRVHDERDDVARGAELDDAGLEATFLHFARYRDECVR